MTTRILAGSLQSLLEIVRCKQGPALGKQGAGTLKDPFLILRSRLKRAAETILPVPADKFLSGSVFNQAAAFAIGVPPHLYAFHSLAVEPHS